MAHWDDYRVSGGIPGQEIVMGILMHLHTSVCRSAVGNP